MFLTSMEIAKEAKKEIDLDTLQSLCGQCGFYKECRTPKMKYTGEGKKKILLVSDRLSIADDDNGIQFAGESGKYLAEVLRKNGISMNKDCWKTSAIRCYSEKISGDDANVLTPAKNCSGYLHKLIYTLKPELVILFSDAPLIAILNDSFSDCALMRWISYHFYDQKFDTTFFATFSPKDVCSRSNDYVKRNIFERDIAVAISGRNISRRDKTDYEKFVKHLTTFKEVISFLDSIIRKKPKVFIDYETSGLKPNRPGHFIATISFALSPTEAYSFPYVFNNYWNEKQLQEIHSRLVQIFSDKEILKLAHNAKFEDTWSYKFFCAIRGWYWDTMTTTHVLDNRKYFVKLKFQTFLRYGVRPYDKHIEQYLIAAKGTEFNTVHKAPLKELLTYNGLDCIFGFKLYEDQTKQLIELAPKGGLKYANSFLFRTSLLMARIQRNGIPMNEKYYKGTREKLSFRINKLKRELTTGKEAKLFREKFNRDINVASGPDLGKMFYEVLEHKAVYTAKGAYKTNKETITKLNSAYGNKLLEIKKLVKARDTYLAQFDREVFNGMMYPFFDLHTARTYRSSSSKPNFQNLPKRDEEIKDAVRAGIIPGALDEVLSEIDFSGAEVITSACVVGDTIIETTQGKKTILEVINLLKTQKIHVYSYSHKKRKVVISEITNGGQTGIKKEVWKVTLDNGETIIATPEHNFMKRDGEYVELRNLKEGMSLMPFVKKERNGYYYINLNNRCSIGEHTMIGEEVFGWNVGGSFDSNLVHHIDENGLNNDYSNLEFAFRKDHTSNHHKGKCPGPMSDETKQKIRLKIKGVKCQQRGRPQSEEKRKRISQSLLGRTFSNESIKKMSDSRKEFWKTKPLSECKICGKKFKTLSNTHILHKHNMSMEEYKKEYNHKVVSIEFYGYKDVYNINVKGTHNFAIGAGIIIKNSYHQDPTFIAYLLDKSTDMHRDLACELWQLSPEMLHNPKFDRDQGKKAKKIRFYAKNNWTFAQFYGDWFDSCGRNLWENCIEREKLVLPNGTPLIEHCNDKGIYALEDFLEHCKDVESSMWNDRFPIYTKWKQDIFAFYRKHLYVETYYGFRFTGYMDRKQVCNYPIQGCLQGCSKVLTFNGWRRIDSLIGKEVKVWTGFAWKNAIGVNRGKCQLATVTLESGLHLDCDIRHEFKNEQNEWVKFSQLKIGDYVALPRIPNRREYKYNVDWYFILGFALGDGWFGSKKLTKDNTRYVMQITGGNTKIEILNDILKFMKRYTKKGFPEPKIIDKGNKFTLHMEGREMAKLFINLGYKCDMNAHTKTIPDSIWNGTMQQQRSFMEGLWLSDGSRKRKSLHMCNLNLLKEVQVLLFGLGYDSFIRKTGSGWKLTPQCVLSENHTSRYFPRNTLDMLLNGKTIKRDVNDNSTITDARNINHGRDCNQKVSERILDRCCPKSEVYRYDKVVSMQIHQEEADTYTMSVQDDLHQFVADGIICKNTSFHNLLNVMMDVERFIIKNKLRTKIVGQIHDSIISRVPKDEIEFYHKGVSNIIASLHERLDWLVVPMEAECAISKLGRDGGNISKMYEIKPKFLNGTEKFNLEKIYE